MTPRRWLVAGGLLLIACLAILWYLAHGDEHSPVIADHRVAPAEPTRVVPAVVPSPHVLEVVTVPPDQIAPLVPPNAPAITLPPDTQLLSQEFVPGTTEWEEVPLVEGSPLVIRFLPAHYNVIVPAPIVLYLEVLDTTTKKRVALVTPRARIRSFEAPEEWIDLAMVDNGTGQDEVAGDHRYTATFVPTKSQQQRLLGHVVVEGIVETREGGVRRIPQALIYTIGPRAHLTGVWRDEVQAGHLILSAEVEVESPGLFTLIGQLVGPAREPIALARTMTPLEQGTHWITMRVWGKAIRDAAIDGPYQVRNVMLTRDMNERHDYDPGPTILLAHRTKPYHAADFMNEPYVESTVSRGEEVGPDHPSQRDNPKPLFPESARPSRHGP